MILFRTLGSLDLRNAKGGEVAALAAPRPRGGRGVEAGRATTRRGRSVRCVALGAVGGRAGAVRRGRAPAFDRSASPSRGPGRRGERVRGLRPPPAAGVRHGAGG